MTPGLDLRLRNADGNPRRLDLTDQQVKQLVSYLGALTDTAFLEDPRFANPFPSGCSIVSNGETRSQQ
jgi:hypothetical protein